MKNILLETSKIFFKTENVCYRTLRPLKSANSIFDSESDLTKREN